MPTRFRVATWNILATAYIRPSYYPNTPAPVLDPRERVPSIVRRAAELDVDILCLQEVERDTFAALESGLGAVGYSGRLALKGARKPDGCATFLREARCVLIEERRLLYADGGDGPDSGHVVQIMTVHLGELRLRVANTHLKWDPPQTPRDQQWGYRQASLALSALSGGEREPVQIVCGDFNVTEEAALMELLRSAGFEATHRAAPGVYSCNSNGVPKLIDYILFRGPIKAEPVRLPSIDGLTPLPSRLEPSDHLPLLAQFAGDGEGTN